MCRMVYLVLTGINLLNVAVVLLLRNLLLRRNHSYQTQYFLHVNAHRLAPPRIHLGLVFRFDHVHRHESHCVFLYCVSLQPRSVSGPWYDRWREI